MRFPKKGNSMTHKNDEVNVVITLNMKFVNTFNDNEYQVFCSDFLLFLRSAGLKISLNWSRDIRPYFRTLNRVWTMLVFTCESSICLILNFKRRILDYCHERKSKACQNSNERMYMKSICTYLLTLFMTCITSPVFHLCPGGLNPPNNAKNPHFCEVCQCDLAKLDAYGCRRTQKTSNL